MTQTPTLSANEAYLAAIALDRSATQQLRDAVNAATAGECDSNLNGARETFRVAAKLYALAGMREHAKEAAHNAAWAQAA